MTETKLVRYAAHIPYTGSVYFEFEAPEGLSKREAEYAAWDALDLLSEDDKEIEEQEYHRYVTEGNVFHGVRNSIEVYPLKSP